MILRQMCVNQLCTVKWERVILYEATEMLARRLLNGELEILKILNMSPNELKEGLTEEEIAKNQPDGSTKMQMTEACWKRCSEKKIGLVEVIRAGHGDRYQLECASCGKMWYAFRDDVVLTTDVPNSVRSVDTTPLATSKFENVGKRKLVSPRETQVADATMKPVEASAPVLKTHKSFNMSKD